MPDHSYTSRRELDQYDFHPAVTLLAPVIAVVLQVELPRLWPPLELLDLPLVVVLFFAVARRSQIAGAVTGTIIGLFQDGLSGKHFGVNGIANAIVGYVAASLSFAVDVENIVNRTALVFLASLLKSALMYVIGRFLEADPSTHLQALHELFRAIATTAVAIPAFFFLDRFRRRE